MSLILRKNCQPLLDEAKLNNYHVDINKDSKYLVIKGECGQPFLSISGISFSRNQPTGSEIDYAVELLEDFLDTHKVDIDTYVKAATTFKAKPIVKLIGDNFIINTPDYRTNHFSLIFTDKYLKYKYDQKGKLISTSIISDSYEPTPEDFDKYKFNARSFALAQTHFINFLAWKKEEDKVDELKSILSKCDI